MADQEWQVLREAFTEFEAEIYKGFLEAQGIEVFISQSGFAHAMGLTVQSGGNRIEILVRPDQLEAAKKIMADYDNGAYEDQLPDEDIPEA